MAAGRYDFILEQGTTFRKTITWKDASGVPVPLGGYSARMQIRDRPGGAVHLTITTENGGIVLDPASGRITLQASPAQTSSITALRGMYDLELVDPAGAVTRLLEGRVAITPEVTV